MYKILIVPGAFAEGHRWSLVPGAGVLGGPSGLQAQARPHAYLTRPPTLSTWQILETRTDGPELRTCLEALSSIYPENTVAARRALRSTIDDQALEQALDFLSGLDGVVAALDGVQRDLDALSATCRAAQDRVGERRASGAALLAEHSAVQRQLAASRARAASVDVFLSRYQLRPEQLAALAGAGASAAAPPDAA